MAIAYCTIFTWHILRLAIGYLKTCDTLGYLKSYDFRRGPIGYLKISDNGIVLLIGYLDSEYKERTKDKRGRKQDI